MLCATAMRRVPVRRRTGRGNLEAHRRTRESSAERRSCRTRSMIDSFGSRSRRNRIAASTQCRGLAPSLAQRSASAVCIVTLCRLSPRASRTTTSNVSLWTGAGLTDMVMALIDWVETSSSSWARYLSRKFRVLKANSHWPRRHSFWNKFTFRRFIARVREALSKQGKCMKIRPHGEHAIAQNLSYVRREA